jgi:branched-chain amino acid transport system permease protein
MSFSGFVVQLLNGLAGASSLFFVAAGLSLIFGVTRIVNFAHGSFFMVGIYVAYTLADKLGFGLGFWPALLIAAVAVGVLGALIEMLLLRRIYKAPELFQLLATFALVLVIKDAVLYFWGPDELLGPRAPGLSGSVEILGRQFPDLRPVPDRRRPAGAGLCGCCSRAPAGARWCAPPRKTARWSARWASTRPGCSPAVFALGALLAGLGGALQLPREPATLKWT